MIDMSTPSSASAWQPEAKHSISGVTYFSKVWNDACAKDDYTLDTRWPVYTSCFESDHLPVFYLTESAVNTYCTQLQEILTCHSDNRSKQDDPARRSSDVAMSPSNITYFTVKPKELTAAPEEKKVSAERLARLLGVKMEREEYFSLYRHVSSSNLAYTDKLLPATAYQTANLSKHSPTNEGIYVPRALLTARDAKKNRYIVGRYSLVHLTATMHLLYAVLKHDANGHYTYIATRSEKMSNSGEFDTTVTGGYESNTGIVQSILAEAEDEANLPGPFLLESLSNGKMRYLGPRKTVSRDGRSLTIFRFILHLREGDPEPCVDENDPEREVERFDKITVEEAYKSASNPKCKWTLYSRLEIAALFLEGHLPREVEPSLTEKEFKSFKEDFNSRQSQGTVASAVWSAEDA